MKQGHTELKLEFGRLEVSINKRGMTSLAPCSKYVRFTEFDGREQNIYVEAGVLRQIIAKMEAL